MTRKKDFSSWWQHDDIDVNGSADVLDAVNPTSVTQTTSGATIFTGASGNQTFVVPAGGTVELASPYSGAISFAGTSGTLIIDDSSSFSGTITGQLGIEHHIDLTDITAGENATITYSGNNSPGRLTVSDGVHTANIALDGNYSLANFTVSSDGHGGTLLVDPPVAPTITSFSSDSGVVGDHITNDSTLTLIGTAAANSTVKVYDGTALLGSATANASGAWSYTTNTLSNGTHNFTAATDTGGSGGGGAGNPPSGFPNASTTGVRDGVKLTPVSGQFSTSFDGQVIEGIDVDTLVINHDGVTVRDCRVGKILVGNAQSNVVTNTTIEYTDVVGSNWLNSVDIEGNNTTIRFCDISGSENGIWLEADGCVIEENYIHNLFSNTGSPDPHIDGIQIPGSNIGATPTENAIIRHNNIDLDVRTANACITMMDGINIDILNNRLNAGSYVIYFEGNSKNSDVVNNVFDEYAFGYVSGASWRAQTYSGNKDEATGTNVLGGTGTTSAVAAASTVTSAPLSVTIDAVAPSVPTIVASTPASSRIEVLTGTAEANSTVKLFDGTTQIGTATANGSGAWSYTTVALSTGSHSFTARAMDAAGNTGAASAAAVVNIAGPTPTPSAPNITSFSNDSGGAGDGITSDNTLALHGTAAANSTIKIYDGSNLIGTATADAAGSWDYITSVLTNATHVLTATATNASGQTSAKSAAVNVTVDTVAPTAPILGSNTIVNTNQVKLSGTAEANSKITVYDGTTAVGTATTSSTGAWSITTSALSNGTHTLTATATDAAGNVSVVSQSVKPVIGTPTSPPPAAPKIVSFTNDSGKVGDNITNDDTLTLKGTAVAYATIKVFDGTIQVGTVKADGSGNWSLTSSVLKDGDHSLTATGTDSSGTTSAASAALAVKIDTHAPDAPTMGLYSKGGSVVSGTTTLDDLVVNGTAEANSKVAIFDGDKQIGTATAGSNGSWSYDTGHLDNGNHSFTAKAIDVAGNTSGSSAAKGVTVNGETSPLDITAFWQNWSHGATIKGTADAYSQVKLFDGNKFLGTVKADGDGDWTYRTCYLSDQVHTFKAQAIDSSGHVATTSGAVILGSSRGNTLTGTAGDDIFIGNGHPDTFVFAANFGKDIIKDFDADGRVHDMIQFSKNVFSDFASVLNHASQVGQDVVISSGDDSLTLKNTKLGALQNHDFHFA